MFKRRRIIILVLGLILNFGILIPAIVFAAERDLSIQLSGVFGKTVSGLPQYISMIYNYAIGLAVSLSIFMVMVGGFLWITAAGDKGKIGKATGLITDAVIGLILTLGAYIILNTINPAILSLKMPEVPKITGQAWTAQLCAEKLEDCPAGQTPINCQCVNVEELQVGGWCLVGDLSAGDAQCAKECRGCTCNPRPSQTCIEIAAKASAEVALAAVGKGVFIDPGSFGAFVNVMKKAKRPIEKGLKVFYKGGKLFLKIPGTKTLAAATVGIFGGTEICRLTSEVCEAKTEDMAKLIGLQQLEDAVGKVASNLEGTQGICYAVANGTVQAGGFCGRDSNCESNVCVPFDPELFARKSQAKQEDWCDKIFQKKTELLSKVVGGKTFDWLQNEFISFAVGLTGSVGEMAKVVIGCEECGTILGNMGICSSGEVGGSCWTDKDDKGNEMSFGCKPGLKCATSMDYGSFGPNNLKSCSDGSEGSACAPESGCQGGLKCVNAGPGQYKCAQEKGAGRGGPCDDDMTCRQIVWPKPSKEADTSTYKDPVCMKPDQSKFEENNIKNGTKYKGLCGRGGMEDGDPCWKEGNSRSYGYCGVKTLICVFPSGGYWRKYTLKEESNGIWGQCKPQSKLGSSTK